MIDVAGLVESLGLLRPVTPGRGGQLHDVVLAEPGEAAGRPGELVLGAGVTGRDEAVALLERADAAGAEGVVLKAPLAAEVAEVARRLGPALVELQPDTSWTHVVWLVRGAIDHAYAPLPAPAEAGGVHNELFALADTAAEIADAPVTVEDARSRVLAYSGRQDTTDPARVSTIVGRRVPPQVIAHLRACGVFRKLARSGDPVLVPAGPDDMLPRLVIPVRAGGEWLGSIWVVARTPVPADRVRRLTDLASVLALHLLRLRAEAGVARRVSADQLRGALRDGTPPAAAMVPAPPWRVAVLGGGEAGDVRGRLDLWESIAHRFGWHRPLLADLDGMPLAVLTDRPEAAPTGRPDAAPAGRPDAEAGSLRWLRHVVEQVRSHDGDLYAAVGGPARSYAELPRSRAEAAELDGLVAAGRAGPGFVLLEEVWDAVVVARARTAVRVEAGLLGGPVGALHTHDEAHGTVLLATLAAWLDHYGDPKGAAQALRVHPNTLRYRLRRMAEVADPDLSSPRARLALRLQLSALLD